MERAYEEAFAEVDEIFKIIPVELLGAIPVQFREVISENKAKDYKVKIEEPLEEKKLKKETVVILGLIYRDFWASPDEREEMQKKDAEDFEKIEQEMQQQYDIQNIFGKRKARINQENELFSTDMIVYKEQSFLKKLFSLIKGLFTKK